jgi:hypothetical protein
MSDLPALKSLLERVEKAEGPDRELDNDIFRALALTDEWSGKRVSKWFIDAGTGWWSCHTDDGWLHQEVQLSPRYSSSLDAALALVEEKMKVCAISTSMDPSGCGATLVWWPDGLGEEREVKAEGCGWTMSQAVLSALLRALIAQKETADV